MYEVYPKLWRILNLQGSWRELCYPQNALFIWKTYSMWRSRVAVFLRILTILRLLAMKKSIAISYIEIYPSFAILNSGIKSEKIICCVISLQPYYTTLWKFYREIRNINIWWWNANLEFSNICAAYNRWDHWRDVVWNTIVSLP